MPDTTDPAASALDQIRADLRAARDGGLSGIKAGDYLPAALARHCGDLLAAVDAALKLADDLDAEAARLLATAARLETGATGTQNRAWAHRDCAKALREAIATALAREGAD
jgi:hypothetical protein